MILLYLALDALDVARADHGDHASAGGRANLLGQEGVPLVDQASFDLRKMPGELGHDGLKLVLLLELLDHVRVDLLCQKKAHHELTWRA